MKCKRLNEVIELLQPAWQKEPELNLMKFYRNWRKSQVLMANWQTFLTTS